MQIRKILYQYIKTLIKHVFLLNFTYELLMSFRNIFTVDFTNLLLKYFKFRCEAQKFILKFKSQFEKKAPIGP